MKASNGPVLTGLGGAISQRKKVTAAILLIVIFSTGVFLRVSNLDVSRRSPDERLCTKYAEVIANDGMQAVRELVRKYNAHKRIWIYPPPIRIGYLYPASIAVKLTRSADPSVLAQLSCAASVLSMLVLILIGLRFFNVWITLYALLFAAVSPMELAMARRAWQDGVFGCIGLLLVYICCEISRNPKRLILYFCFFIIGAYLPLVKESGAVIYGLGVLWIAWTLLITTKKPRQVLLFIIFAALAASVSFLVMVKVCGGIQPVIEVVRNTMASLIHNEYNVSYQRGPWYYYLRGLWLLSPFATVFGVFGALMALIYGRSIKDPAGINSEDRSIFFNIVLFIVTFICIATIPEYLKNLRFISPVFGAFYLISGLGFWYLISFITSRAKSFLLATALAISAIVIIVASLNDYNNFTRIFIKGGAPDLVNRQFIERGMSERQA